VAAIRAVESATTGQIHVHVSHRRVADAFASAADQFHRLGMEATEQRNAVLIYVAPRTRTFAVFGDAGIHQRCGDDFWRAVVAEMEGELRQGRVTEGIVRGIDRLGETLAEHFPRGSAGQPGNELPDEPTAD
jgi:uncharacterized membrane protein